MEYICVFASSSARLAPPQYAFAKALGREIAKNGYGLIFGGGRLGLMGAVADAVIEEGGRIIGVIPERLNQPGVAHTACHELIVTPTMHIRKQIMENRCIAFVTLPGGFGTLEELMEVITLRQLGYHDKPVVICNPEGYYDSLIAQFDKGFREGFQHDAYRALYSVAGTPGAAFAYAVSGEKTDLPDKMNDSRVME